MIAELLGVGSLITSILGASQQLEQGFGGASIADQNADLARRNAVIAQAAGREQARQIRYAGAKITGQQRASYGRAHLAGGGSLLDVEMDSAREYEFDAEKAIYASEAHATNLLRQANMSAYQAKLLRRGAITGGITSVLGGAINATAAIHYGKIYPYLYNMNPLREP